MTNLAAIPKCQKCQKKHLHGEFPTVDGSEIRRENHRLDGAEKTRRPWWDKLPVPQLVSLLRGSGYLETGYMGMALKTLWIVPRWSGRLERGGYVKGHDPEVSKAPAGRSCFHDMTSYVYMSLWLDQRSHGKVERSIPARPGTDQVQCSHFGFNLTVSTLATVDMSSKVIGLRTKSLKKGKKPNNHTF